MSYNPLAALRGLFPQPRLQIGTVQSISNGDAVIQLLDGSRLTAQGSANIGDRVYVRNGLIEGAAPDLAVVEIEV